MPDFIPRSDAKFMEWSRNFAVTLAIDPESLGLTVGEAARYAELDAAFREAYTRTANLQLRTRVDVAGKDGARAEAVAEARKLAAIVRARPEVTDEQRIHLGLPVPAARRRGVAPPGLAARARLQVLDVCARRVTLRMYELSGAGQRSRPAGAAGAVVFAAAGKTPPAFDPTRWRYAGSTAALTGTFMLPADAQPGERVWLVACWQNARGKLSSAGEPVFVHVGYEGMQLAA